MHQIKLYLVVILIAFGILIIHRFNANNTLFVAPIHNMGNLPFPRS